MRLSTRLAVVVVPLVLVLSACGGSDPYEAKEGGDGSTITVGSADFPESTLLAHIYAKALEAKGLKVDTQLNIGSREVYFDQVESGNLSVFPEYNGGILLHLDPEATTGTTEETNKAVRERLPKNLEILDSAEAQNKDSVSVTKETAEKENLKTLGDLKDVAGDMVIGGPPEFETRAQGIPGLKEAYGVEFGDFRSMKATVLPAALKDDDIQAANLFTTDPAIAANGFVVLDDPENMFGAQNVTPVINTDTPAGGKEARAALNAVSAELTTDALARLNEKVSVDHESPDEVAATWLESKKLA